VARFYAPWCITVSTKYRRVTDGRTDRHLVTTQRGKIVFFGHNSAAKLSNGAIFNNLEWLFQGIAIIWRWR